MTSLLAIQVALILSTVILAVDNLRRRAQIRRLETLYPFCDVRRELMALVADGKLDPRSLAFEYLYRFSSDIIHYSNDYRFGSSDFIRAVLRDEKNIEREAFVRKFLASVEHEGEPAKALASKFFLATMSGFMRNSWILRCGALIWPIFQRLGAQKHYLERAFGKERVRAATVRYDVYQASKRIHQDLATAA